MEFVRHASRAAALTLGMLCVAANAELPSHPIVQVLKPSTADINTEKAPYRTLDFGSAIAVYKNVALVGEPGANSGGLDNSGRVAVFTRRDGTWQRTGTFTSPSPRQFAGFGNRIALENDSALIGDSNTIYVYKYTSATGWKVVQWVRPANTDSSFEYPMNIEYKCGNALVTAYEGTLTMVYAYERRSDGRLAYKARWVQPTDDQEFGRSLAVDCDVAAVGAGAIEFNEDRPGNPGVYVYRKVNGAWRYTQTLVPTGLAPGGEGLGNSVAIKGQYIFAGVPGKSPEVDTNAGTSRQGVVYVFARTTGGYAETGHFRPSLDESSHYVAFGGSLKPTEDGLVVEALVPGPYGDPHDQLFFSYTNLGPSPKALGIAHAPPDWKGYFESRGSGRGLFVVVPDQNPECYFCVIGSVNVYDLARTQ
jgi:hypothetical protein